ncbi:hypothetical protein FQN60_007028 [Etheostoma spectabile]|uniref:DRBM domain-containing protein n=1 Tax=Etheostoma spectabile TaxID=54343 RepID=A0A5J5CG30_9PERO|nr:hypothetical protein FQN60_007028 [Etheostoma spectabile]
MAAGRLSFSNITALAPMVRELIDIKMAQCHRVGGMGAALLSDPDKIEAAIRYNNHAFNTKYCLCQMLRDKVESPLGKQVQAAQTNGELSEAFGLQEFYRRTQDRLQARRDALQTGTTPDPLVMDGDVATMPVKFERREYPPHITPKMFLLEWSRREKLQQPQYQMVRSTYSDTPLTRMEKSKKFAEQAAAVVCLRVLGVPEGRIGEEDSGLVCKRKRDGKTSGAAEDEATKKRHALDLQQETDNTKAAAAAANGDAASGDAASGDAANGDAANGDAANGDAASGDAASGDAASGDAANGDAAPGHP